MFCIVSFSVLVGSFTPLLLTRMNLDPASGAAPVIATFMDIVGVFVACLVSNNLLPT